MTDHRIYVIMEKCMKSILYTNKYFYISSEGYVFRPITWIPNPHALAELTCLAPGLLPSTFPWTFALQWPENFPVFNILESTWGGVEEAIGLAGSLVRCGRWWPLHADTIKIETSQQCKLANKQANSETQQWKRANNEVDKVCWNTELSNRAPNTKLNQTEMEDRSRSWSRSRGRIRRSCRRSYNRNRYSDVEGNLFVYNSRYQGIERGWKRGKTTWENFCNYNKIFTNNLQLFAFGWSWVKMRGSQMGCG